MHFRKLVRICQLFYSNELFSFCPVFVILGCCFRMVLAFYDVFQITRCQNSPNVRSWYYDQRMYSENIIASCLSHIVIIIVSNAALLIGVTSVDENFYSYPWLIMEFIEIILQFVGVLCEPSLYSTYRLFFKFYYWLATGCLVLGRTCVMKNE